MTATKTAPSDLTTYPGPRRLLRDERGRAVVTIEFQPGFVAGDKWRTEVEPHWVAAVLGWGHSIVATSSDRAEVVAECRRRFGDYATPQTAVWRAGEAR